MFEKEFPSPIGELHFSIRVQRNPLYHAELVSVPYRGATFLNFSLKNVKVLNIVSVPYRGATFLNEGHCLWNPRFPIVSVPYRGATFLNS